MAGSGLAASVWAPRRRSATIYPDYTENHATTIHAPRPGDWGCPSCGFLNFQFRTECLKCHLQCPYKGLREVSGNLYNTASATASENEAPTHAHPAHDAPVHIRVQNGLATSAWASLKHREMRKMNDPVTAVSPLTPTRLKAQDLGLPYEVQHYILAMMQRIMEEGCYDFANKWVPQKLIDKNWTCYQQVELSMWRDFLPEACPIKSIDPIPNYTLEAALADAVHTRNSAVHRHLCDNTELRHMAIYARDLMFMFGDVTRHDKFQRLIEGLWEWDHSTEYDQQTRRTQLEVALREINEAAIDDMEWVDRMDID